MSVESEIKFEVALRDFIKNFFPKIEVDQSALTIISKILKGFNSEFIKEMLTYKNMPLLNTVQCAVEKKLPSGLKKLALAEAHRQLALYEMGSSEYDDIRECEDIPISKIKEPRGSKVSETSVELPAKKVKRKSSTGSKKTKKVGRSKKDKKQIVSKVSKTSKKPKKRSPKKEKGEFENIYSEPPTGVFKPGISKLHELTHSTLKIGKDALEYLSACLFYFSKTMAAKLTERYPGTEIDPKDIKDILAECSGPNLHQSAVSEGIKCVTLFMNGLLSLKIDSSKRELPMKAEEFREGIELFLKKEFFEPISLELDTSEYIEHLLMKFLELFATDASELCLKHKIRTMTDNELRMTAEDILAEELRRHAMIRGDKAVSDFQTGIRTFTKPDIMNGPIVPEISKKKNSLTKEELLNPKPKRRPKKDNKSTAKLKIEKETPLTPKVAKKKKPSKKIKKLVNKILKKE